MSVAKQKHGGTKMSILIVSLFIAFLALVFIVFFSPIKPIIVYRKPDTVIEFIGGRLVEVEK